MHQVHQVLLWHPRWKVRTTTVPCGAVAGHLVAAAAAAAASTPSSSNACRLQRWTSRVNRNKNSVCQSNKCLCRCHDQMSCWWTYPKETKHWYHPQKGWVRATCVVECIWYLIMFAAASDSNPSLLLRFFFLRWPSQSFVCLWILSACWQLYRTIHAQQHGQWNEWCQVCCECCCSVVLFVGDHHCWFVFLFVLIFSTSAMSVSPRIMPDGGGSKWEDELNPPDNVPTLHMLEFQTKNETT